MAQGVTIFISAYNYAHFVADAIESALAQDYPEVEVLVVDDGSTDNTREVVEQFASRGVRYVYQENGGLSAARNTGIRHARHDWIISLDADDKLDPDAISVLAGKMNSLPQEFGVVACCSRIMNASGAPVERDPYKRWITDREVSCRNLVMKNRFSASVLIKKAVFEKAGYFDTTLTASEDRDMWIRIARHARILQLQRALLMVRHHEANMSSNARRQTAAMRKVIAKARDDGAVSRWDVLFWLRVRAFYYYQSAVMHKDADDNFEAWREILLSFVWCPYLPAAGSVEMTRFFRARWIGGLLRDSFNYE